MLFGMSGCGGRQETDLSGTMDTDAGASPEPSAVPSAAPTALPSRYSGDWFFLDAVLSISDGSAVFSLDGRETALSVEETGSAALCRMDPDVSGDPVFQCERSGDDLTVKLPSGTDLVFSTDPEKGQEPEVSVSLPEEKDSSEPPEVTDVFSCGGVVCVVFDRETDAVLLSSVPGADQAPERDWYPCSGRTVRIFKSDGDYYVFGKNSAGISAETVSCSVRSGYRYVYFGEGMDPVSIPVSEFLESKGDSLERMNREIADRVSEAGMYSRAGVAAAAVTLVSQLAEYDAAVPYQGLGRYNQESDWGIPERWGSKLEHKEYDNNGSYTISGLHCAASSMWAYRQAGLNTVSKRKDVALYGFGRHSGNYRDNIIPRETCRSGDLLKTSTTHTMLVVDRLDRDGDGIHDAYLALEMISPVMTLSIRPFRSIRTCTAYDMSGLFDDTGEERKFAAYWPDTYYIPESAWPDYLRESAGGTPARIALRQLQNAVETEGPNDD